MAQIILFICFISLWQILSSYKIINPIIFSSPSKIITLIIEKCADGSLPIHVLVTSTETLLGFLIGTIGGIILASILWFSSSLAKISDPYLVVLNAMPKVALGPIIIVILGPSYLSIILMGAIISLIITTIVILSGFNHVDENYLKVLRSFRANRWIQFKEAVFPATIPTIVSTLKVNVGLSWVGVIVGEFIVSNNGLGYLIIYGFQVFDFTLVLASLTLIVIVATIMYMLVEKIEKHFSYE